MRFLASGGWADQDPDVIADLLKQAQELASIVAADENASSKSRDLARGFLAQLDADTLG
jgi:hypothetical protein